MLAMTSSSVWSTKVLRIMQSLTVILPSVIVPVLSRHSTLTRASISREYRSCTRVCFLASLRTPTAIAKDVSSNSPEGIMPTTTAQVDWMIALTVLVGSKRLIQTIAAATSGMRRLIARMNTWMEFMISERGFLYFFALDVRLLR